MADVPEVPDLRAMSVAALLALYRGILKELQDRGVVRTDNAPAGDYAEFLVARALEGELAPKSEKSWDVQLRDGARLQVKSRVVSDPPKASQLQLSPFRSFEFDELVIVLLRASDYGVQRAVRIPRVSLEGVGHFSEHVNGQLISARPELLSHADATDITDLLLAALAPTSGGS